MFLRIMESICGVMQRKEEMAWSGKCCTMPGQRCSNSQFALSHLCLFASILKNLTRIKRVGCLFGSCAFGSTFLAELGIKNGIVVNDFVIVCHGCKDSKSCRIMQLFCECLPMSAPYESTKDRKWTQNEFFIPFCLLV